MRINPFYLHGEELTPVRKLLALKALSGGVPLSEYTTTGNPVTFETNVAKPLSECLVSFSPVQSGTGDPSPENIRSITGWTGATVYRTGKNLLSPDAITSDANNIYLWWANGLYLSAGKYTLTTEESMSQLVVRDFLTNTNISSVYNNSSLTFTLSAGTKVKAFAYKTGIDRTQDIQLEIGETPSTFKEYTGESVSVTFPAEAGTVYGGTLDLTTGVLTVDKKSITIDGNTPGWSTYNNPSAQGLTFSIGLDNKATVINSSLCDKFKNAGNVSIWDYDIRGVIADNKNQNRLFFNAFEPVADLAAWKAWIADNNLQVVYKLAAPVTYQLTPTEIQTLIGTNVLWSDTNGDMEVKYLKKG